MMKKFAIILNGLLTTFCIAPGNVSAQYESSIQQFNTANGLSQNTITGMAFDKTGYLWLGTQNGLIRYDGSNFKTYLSNQNNSDINGSNTVLNVSSILSDKKVLIRMRDGLVYTTENGRPLLYSDAVKNTTYYYELDGHFPSLAIFDQFNLPIPTLIEIHKWNHEIRAVLPLNKNDFIVSGEKENELLYYKRGTQQKKIQVDGRFKKFLKSAGYGFMIDDKFNLYLYDSLSATFNKVAVDWSGIEKDAGKINGSLFLWDKLNDQSYCFYNAVFYLLQFDSARRIIKFVPRFSLKDAGHFWTNITYDSANSTYFLSTLTEGLFQVKLKQVQTFNSYNKPASGANVNNSINYALLQTSDSTVLTTTGYEFTSKGTHEISIAKKGKIDGNRETIARIGDTAILCVQHNQLMYYSKTDGFQQSRVFNGFFNKNYSSFITLLQPEGDSVWVCSDAGIFSIKQNNVNVLFHRKHDDQSLYFGPRLFYRLSEKEVLFSNNLGLYKLHTTPPYTIDTFPAMNDKQVRCIVKYKGVFLLSVYKYGLFTFDGNVFRKVPVSEGQPEISFCHSTYIDNKENLWVATDKGLFRSTVSSVIESATKPGMQPFFFSYGESDGIANTEFNGGGTPSYALLTNGQLFYPSMGGIVTFNPSSLNINLIKGTIPVEKIQVDDNESGLPVTDSVKLNPDFKLLSIELSVPYFGKPENLSLEYNLDKEGWKKIPVSPSQKIMLYDVSPGYHELLMRKRVGFGNADYIYQKLIIYRQKHLYQRILFYPALLLVITLMILLFIKLRTERINAQRRKLQIRVDEQTSALSKNVEAKELLIDIISRDMITPLKEVSAIAGRLSKDPEKDPEKLTETLSVIKAASAEILSDSQGIINYMKYNSNRVIVNRLPVNLFDAVHDVCDNFLSVAHAKKISLINEVNEEIFAEIDENIFGIILSNIISNAVKYSRGDRVQIFTEPSPNTTVILKIKDNGVGINNKLLGEIRKLSKGNFQETKTNKSSGAGLGFILVAELIRIHDLSFSIDGELNKGTTVAIKMPYRSMDDI